LQRSVAIPCLSNTEKATVRIGLKYGEEEKEKIQLSDDLKQEVLNETHFPVSAHPHTIPSDPF
jgi:hypothetical protein